MGGKKIAGWRLSLLAMDANEAIGQKVLMAGSLTSEGGVADFSKEDLGADKDVSWGVPCLNPQQTFSDYYFL